VRAATAGPTRRLCASFASGVGRCVAPGGPASGAPVAACILARAASTSGHDDPFFESDASLTHVGCATPSACGTRAIRAHRTTTVEATCGNGALPAHVHGQGLARHDLDGGRRRAALAAHRAPSGGSADFERHLRDPGGHHPSLRGAGESEAARATAPMPLTV